MGNVFRWLVLMVVLALPAALGGCSSSSSGGDHDYRNYEKYVRYSYDCANLACYDTSNQIDFNSDGHRARTCVWNCGTGYKQSIKAYVALKFEQVNGCWQLTHDEFTGDFQGLCN